MRSALLRLLLLPNIWYLSPIRNPPVVFFLNLLYPLILSKKQEECFLSGCVRISQAHQYSISWDQRMVSICLYVSALSQLATRTDKGLSEGNKLVISTRRSTDTLQIYHTFVAINRKRYKRRNNTNGTFFVTEMQNIKSWINLALL